MIELYILGENAVSLIPVITQHLLKTDDIPLLPQGTNTRVIERNYSDRLVTILLYEKREMVIPFAATVFGFVVILEAMPWRNDALHLILIPAGGLANTRGKPPNPMSNYKKFVFARKKIIDGILNFVYQECVLRGLQAYSPAQMKTLATHSEFFSHSSER